MAQLDLLNLVQEKIVSLKPYQVENVDCRIKLHANENPFPPSGELMGLFHESLEELRLNRYPDPDCQSLKQAIAEKINRPTENLVIGNGSDEMIQLLLQIFCNAGDCIAFPDPTFAMYSIIAQGMGLKPVAIPLNDRWNFNAGQFLEAAAKVDPKIIFFSYPNNPTGNCFADKEIHEVIDKFQGIVVLDEAYYDFSSKTFLSEMEKHNNLVLLRTLSKIGLAGLRIGYAVSHPVITEQLNKIRLPYNSNSISQGFAEKLLKNFSTVQSQIDIILEERDYLYAALSDIDTITVFPTDSNFILFRVDGEGKTVFQSLKKNDILIRDLGGHPRLANCLRVTVGAKEENQQFLKQLTQSTAQLTP